MGDRMKLQRYESLLDDEETGRGNSPLDDEEFVSGSTPMAGRRRTPSVTKRTQKRLLYGLLAIACLSILLVLVFAGPSRAPGAEQPPTDQNNSTLPIPPKNTTKKPEKILAKPKDFQNGVFRASQKGLAWAKGGQKDGLYLEQKGKEIYLKHVEDDDDVTLLMAAPADAKLQDYQEWTVSKDLKRILLAVDYEKEWRHSYFANYWIYDVIQESFKKLTESKPKDHGDQYEQGAGKVSLAVWSPTGHSIAWVRDNDMYATLEDGRELQLTTDGSPNIINGIADWVYEEEIFAAHEALWFSTDSSKLAFVKFNETLVKQYKLQYYMRDSKSSYPIESVVKYPRPGSPNPLATLHIVDLTATHPEQNSDVIYQDPTAFKPEDSIITQVTWDSRSSLLIRIMNRVQDHQKLYRVSPVNGKWTGVLLRDEPSGDGAWFDKLAPMYALQRKDPLASSYIELQEDGQGFTHLAYYQNVSSPLPTEWLTKGRWEVTELSSFDVEKETVYFMSTEEGSTQRHLYAINLTTREKKRLTPFANTESTHTAVPYKTLIESETKDVTGFYSVSFSPKAEWFVVSYQGPDVPWQRIVSTRKDLAMSMTQNAALAKTIRDLAIPQVTYMTIANDAGDAMNVKMITPADFESNGNVKYPVIFNPYGGPTSQMVDQHYQSNFPHAMAAAGFIYVVVDGRGTGFKGRKYRSVVSKNLGEVEALDQIAAARWMSKQPYVEPSRIAIWGWSYGGYLTAKVVEKDSGLFSTAISVAPVTDWRFYDSMYTERYMKTLSSNLEGYEKSSVSKTDGFERVKFLLAHGLSDDNVHFQHSATLVWKLTGNGVRHTVQYYTDSDHSISANGANRAVYQLLVDFVCGAFNVSKFELS